MRRFQWFGLAMVAASLLPLQAQAQTRRFDGTWSVEVLTERGGCDQYRYSIIIERGRARYGGPENFDVRGQVRPNGSVSASIFHGRDRADVTGRLAGRFGRGTWVTSGSRPCAGRWNAEKRS